MPVLSLACHLPHNTPHIPSRYNNEQTTKQTKAINNSYIYINISCKCDTNRAGHFTLDAYASRPVACFPYLLILTGNLHGCTTLYSHLRLIGEATSMMSHWLLCWPSIITCCYISCIYVCMIVLEINILPQARFIRVSKGCSDKYPLILASICGVSSCFAENGQIGCTFLSIVWFRFTAMVSKIFV